jgi:hypothetical protein
VKCWRNIHRFPDDLNHGEKHDEEIRLIFEAIRQLLETDDKPKPKIGYTVKERQKKFGKGQAKSISGGHDMPGSLDASDR